MGLPSRHGPRRRGVRPVPPPTHGPTLSTPIFLKAACSTLKLWMYSCSSLAWNFTFRRWTQPGNSMSMNWQ